MLNFLFLILLFPVYLIVMSIFLTHPIYIGIQTFIVLIEFVLIQNIDTESLRFVFQLVFAFFTFLNLLLFFTRRKNTFFKLLLYGKIRIFFKNIPMLKNKEMCIFIPLFIVYIGIIIGSLFYEPVRGLEQGLNDIELDFDTVQVKGEIKL